MNDVVKTIIPSGNGERGAMGGYRAQYDEFSRRVYDCILNGDLECIRVADAEDNVGKLDDICYVTDTEVHAYQVKWTNSDDTFTYIDFKSLIKQVAEGWKKIKAIYPTKVVIPHLLTNRKCSTADRSIKGNDGKTLGTFADYVVNVITPLCSSAELSDKWAVVLDELNETTGLTEGQSSEFWGLHFILYVYDQTCKEQLDAFCKAKFHEYVDRYRHDIESRGEAEKREFEKIVKAHVSTQPFDLCLPDLIVTSKNPDGQIYKDHLYCDGAGNAVFKLDTWEDDVLQAERQKEGFVCWLRNIPNKESSLCIQYKSGTELKPLFPDFIIVRKVNDKFEFSVLEPHFTGYADSVPKLKGMAEYSERCTSVGRNEMLRVVESPSGKKIQTINVAFSAVRNVVYLLNDHDELNNLFIRFNDQI